MITFYEYLENTGRAWSPPPPCFFTLQDLTKSQSIHSKKRPNLLGVKSDTVPYQHLHACLSYPEVEKGRQHGNIVARKKFWVLGSAKNIWGTNLESKKRKTRERKEMQTGEKNKKSIIYSGL